jgi:hypothetical protein
MNRKLANVLAFATAAAAAALSGSAYADDITVDNAPFISSRSRAEVQAELLKQVDLVRTGAGEWSMQHNYVPQLKSAYTREEAQSQFKFSRGEVSALNSEDSGSSYFKRSVGVNTATMGGPARIELMGHDSE